MLPPTKIHRYSRVLSFLRSKKLETAETILLLQLSLKPKGITLPNLSLTTHARFTLTVLHDVPMEVCLDWVVLDLFGRLCLAGEAARGVKRPGLSPL